MKRVWMGKTKMHKSSGIYADFFSKKLKSVKGLHIKTGLQGKKREREN